MSITGTVNVRCWRVQAAAVHVAGERTALSLSYMSEFRSICSGVNRSAAKPVFFCICMANLFMNNREAMVHLPASCGPCLLLLCVQVGSSVVPVWSPCRAYR